MTRRAKKKIALRDSQRSRLYAAERDALLCFGFTRVAYMAEIPKVQKFVNRVLSSVWLRRSLAKIAGEDAQRICAPVLVVAARANCATAFARTKRSTITLPEWARTEFYVLHEVCHILTNRMYGHRKVAGHGREYARLLVLLTQHFLGLELAGALRRSFKKHRVTYSQRRRKIGGAAASSRKGQPLPEAARKALEAYRARQRTKHADQTLINVFGPAYALVSVERTVGDATFGTASS